VARKRRKASLRRYRSKRDFRRSPEPEGGAARGRARDDPIFVVQQHDARSRHFDFRIEAGGVLKSWAVPKGPSLDPRDRRLALATEDHPLEYAEFEGRIPEGEYGAGTVIVWDAGRYRNLTRVGDRELPIAAALDRGRAVVKLQGRKLRGGFALVRGRLRGGRHGWLLVKLKDQGADARRNPVASEPASVLSGRTLEEEAERGKRLASDDGEEASR